MMFGSSTTGMERRSITLFWFLIMYSSILSTNVLFPMWPNHTRQIIAQHRHMFKVMPPKAFCNMPSLEHLVLKDIFTGPGHILDNDSLHCLYNLVDLDLSRNNILQLPIGVFSQLRTLKTLVLKGEFKSIATQSDIGVFKISRRFHHTSPVSGHMTNTIWHTQSIG